jgi:hypothetical protein
MIWWGIRKTQMRDQKNSENVNGIRGRLGKKVKKMIFWGRTWKIMDTREEPMKDFKMDLWKIQRYWNRQRKIRKSWKKDNGKKDWRKRKRKNASK